MLLGIKGQCHQKIPWDDFLPVLLVICDILSILFILISHFPSQHWKIYLLVWDQWCEMTQNTELECKRIVISASVKWWCVDPNYFSHLICRNWDRPSVSSLCCCFSFGASFVEPFDITSKLKQLNKTDSPETPEGGPVELLTGYAAQEMVLDASTASFWHTGDTVSTAPQVQQKGDNSDAYGIPYTCSASVMVFIYTNATMNF